MTIWRFYKSVLTINENRGLHRCATNIVILTHEVQPIKQVSTISSNYVQLSDKKASCNN